MYDRQVILLEALRMEIIIEIDGRYFKLLNNQILFECDRERDGVFDKVWLGYLEGINGLICLEKKMTTKEAFIISGAIVCNQIEQGIKDDK